RGLLAKAALATGDLDGARTYLDLKTAGDAPALLLALADIELRSGRLDQVREIVPRLLSVSPESRDAVVELAWQLDGSPDAAFICVDAAVDAAASAREFDYAATVLQEFVSRRPGYIAALLKLVE